MLSDIEIAESATLVDIREVAAKLNLTENELELYGKYKAKVDYNILNETDRKDGRTVYEGEIRSDSGFWEFVIDAQTGRFLEWETEGR